MAIRLHWLQAFLWSPSTQHFIHHEHFLCNGTTRDTLRFFSFAVLPVRIATLVNAQKRTIRLHHASSCPQLQDITTRISQTVAPFS